MAEVAFQILDAHGDGRVRRVEPVGRRREAAELGGPIERLDLSQVHEADVRNKPRHFLDIGILELNRSKNIVCTDGSDGRYCARSLERPLMPADVTIEAAADQDAKT